jgi:hypothetical protein
MNKRQNDFLQERVVLSFDHPEVTEDTEWKIFKVPAGRRLRVDQVDYLNVTGLAEGTTNVYALSLKNGSTVMAGPLSTDSDLSVPDASIVANTFTDIPVSATASELIAEAGDVLSFLADEGASQTLPAGRVIVHARYVQ